MKQQILEARLDQIEALARRAVADGMNRDVPLGHYGDAMVAIFELLQRWRAEK